MHSFAIKASFEKEALLINGTKRYWEFAGGDGLISLVGGREIDSAMEEIIKNAKEKVYIQMSTFNDPSLSLLIKKKAMEGVEVKILLSDFNKQLKNSHSKKETNRIQQELKNAGVDVQIFNDEQLLRETDQLRPESHRKIIVVDSKVAYIGSANINEHDPAFDLGILVNRNLAKELSNFFISEFSFSSSSRLIEFERFLIDVKNSKVKFTHGREYRYSMLKQISLAKESIDIAVFELNDDLLIKALVNKKLENPELEINVLLGPAFKNKTWRGREISIPQNLLAFEKLNKAGINIRWAGDFMQDTGSIVHAKSMVIDRKFIFAGSSDFNKRSFEGNLELDYEIESKILASDFSDAIRLQIIFGKSKTLHSKKDKVYALLFKQMVNLMSFVRNYKRHSIDKITLHPAFLRLKLRKLQGKLIRLKRKFKININNKNNISKNHSEAIARLYKALSQLSSKNGNKLKVIKNEKLVTSKIDEQSHYFYGGFHSRGAFEIRDEGFRATRGGYFGDGIYVASSPETAIDYSLIRAFQDKENNSNAHIMLIKANVNKVYVPERDLALFEKWLKSKDKIISSSNQVDLMYEFLRSNNYNSIQITAAEGPNADYFMFLNPKDLEVVNHFQIQ
jgi:phosphatidylserine/phosphatidylglycerophosphate/cardiolipin synthase-like enzyme